MQKNSGCQVEQVDEIGLNYLDKKLFHMIELQIMDIENSLHYMQKKNSLSQIKESLAQIYNIFNQTEPLFRFVKGLFLHAVVKKLMNCFGIIYLTLMQHIERGRHNNNIEPNINNRIESANKQPTNKENELPYNTNPSLQTKSHPMGGITLYNENYARHINTNNPIKPKKPSSNQQLTKQQFNRQVRDQLNQSPEQTSTDQNVDFFAFKFKYARQNSTAFHDQLQSIANFFRQSQNEAFQFLSKTKEQNAAMSYDDKFQDTLVQLKLQNERKMVQFAEKIRAAFRSIKLKTHGSPEQTQQKTKTERLQQTVPPLYHHEQTQTVTNPQQEIKTLHQKIADAEERYSIMVDVKRKEMQESLSLGMQLENQLGIRNREVVYLKLKIEEEALVISSLNKRLKFLNEHRKRSENTSLPKETLETSKAQAEQQPQEQTPQPDIQDDQQTLQAIRKQKKMAKLIMLERRRGSILETKNNFIMKFSQPEHIPLSPAQSFSEKWNLQEIAENYREESEQNNESSQQSNSTLLQGEEDQILSKTNMEGRARAQFNLSDKSIHKSIHSNADITKPTRSKKQKNSTNSVIVNQGRKQSFISKMNSNAGESEAPNFQEGTDEEDASNSRQLNMRAQQMNKMERKLKKQTNMTNSNIHKQTNPKKLSIFAMRRKSANIIEFNPGMDKNNRQCRPNNSRGDRMKIKGSFRVASSNKMEKQQIGRAIAQYRRTESSEKRKKAQPRMLTQQDQSHLSSASLKSIPSLTSSESENASVQGQKIDAKQWKQAQTETDPLQIITLSPNEYNLVVYPCEKQSQMVQTEASEGRTLGIYQQNQMTAIYTWNNGQTECNDGNNERDGLKNRNCNYPKSHQIGSTVLLQKSSSSLHLRRSKQSPSEALLRYIKHNTCNDAIESDEENNHQQSPKRYKNGKTQQQQNRYSNYEAMGEQHERQHKAGEERYSINARLFTTSQHQEQQIKQLTLKCRTLQQFKQKASQLHANRCGKTCPHLQKFVASFLRHRQPTKQKMHLPISNLHDTISYKIEPLPILRSRKDN